MSSLQKFIIEAKQQTQEFLASVDKDDETMTKKKEQKKDK